jgi:ParB-like chromosome segregation protein Spo0J
MTKRKWRDALSIHPACDALPLMSADELRELADDIERHGLHHNIDLYLDLKTHTEYVIDGRNRLDAMELLGWDLIDDTGRLCSALRGHQLDSGYREPEHLVAWVISANIRRRHLNQEQRRELLAKLLKANPSKSNRQVAKAAGVDHKTVAAVRAEVEARGEIPHVETITDTQGREQPAKKCRAEHKEAIELPPWRNDRAGRCRIERAERDGALRS